MCRERDAILLGTLGFKNCGIIVVWISHVIFDGFIESVIVNENGNRKRQRNSKQRGYPKLPKQASSACADHHCAHEGHGPQTALPSLVVMQFSFACAGTVFPLSIWKNPWAVGAFVVSHSKK